MANTPFPFAVAGVAAYLVGLALPLKLDLPLVLLAVCSVAAAFTPRSFSALRIKSIIPASVLFFMLSWAISTAASIDPAHSLGLSTALLPGILLFLLIAGCFDGILPLRILFISLVLLSFILSSMVLWTYLQDPNGHPSSWVADTGSPILVVPNDTIIVALLAPFSLALIQHERTRIGQIAAALPIPIGLLAILVVNSRTALLTFMVVTAFSIALTRPKVALVWGLCVAAISIAIDGLLGFPTLSKFNTLADTRLSLWLAAIAMFLDAPILGIGPHSYGLVQAAYLDTLDVQAALPQARKHTPWPHNLYLEVLAEQGSIGALALVATLVNAARIGWRLCRITTGDMRTYSIATLSALIGFCLAGLLELSFIRLWVIIIFFVLLGMLEFALGIARNRGV